MITVEELTAWLNKIKTVNSDRDLAEKLVKAFDITTKEESWA
jgi:hypothetical protein